MPVYKFRTLKEASVALWSSPDDPKLPDRIRGWWRTCARFRHTQAPRGVRRFTTLEKANAERDSWVVETLMTGKPGPTAR
jgi:hypothetical protein